MSTHVPELPGTLWVNRGRWNWRVRLPGEKKRRNFPLRLSGAKLALPEERGRDLAVSLAWRQWEKVTREHDAEQPAAPTLDSVAGQFCAWARTYYRRADGSLTGESDNCEYALRPLRAKLGDESIDNVGYASLLQVRDTLETSGLQRTTINQRVGIWRRFIAWALENRLCLPTTKAEWCALGNLKRHRSSAPEGEPVAPVPHAQVKRALPFMPEHVQAMVRVQEFTGMRPGELRAMRPCNIERKDNVWIYRPPQHKNAHRGQPRVIVIGPRAQRVLSSMVGDWGSGELIFADVAGRNSYAQAVRRACRSAGVDRWTPNQLRHACGTRVRRKFGVDAARAVLGHARGDSRITDRYTREAIEAEVIEAATPPMLSLG